MNPTSRLSELRGLARQRANDEHCEVCGMKIPGGHPHLVEPASGRLLCSCKACSLLFEGRRNGRYRVVPDTACLLTNFAMTDAQWEDLRIPISLAFFCRHSRDNEVKATYPSPAGPVEAILPAQAWSELEEANLVLRELEPDVEALLVNRVGAAREYFRVGLHECYVLVGLLRRNWHGLSGGDRVWEVIAQFFQRLRDESAHQERTGNG